MSQNYRTVTASAPPYPFRSGSTKALPSIGEHMDIYGMIALNV
jgi:hypothetical protein